MPTHPALLHIDSSPRGDYSASRKLSAEFVASWRNENPDGEVIRRDLYTTNLPPVTMEWIAAAYTPDEQRSPEQRSALKLSDELIAELLRADQYVLGVPMFNFTIPAVLKLYIDQIARVGKTFGYTNEGVKGLLEGKQAYVLAAHGGSYGAGSPLAELNFLEPYLQRLFGFLGVKDINFVATENMSRVATGQITLDSHLAPTLAVVRDALTAA
jgi:FMN-dependent NADH-azoreductase